MGDSGPNEDVFDVNRIRRLIELMNDHELSEVDLQQGDLRIRLRSKAEAIAVAPVVPAAPVAPQAAPAASAEPPEDDEYTSVVKSPMVGTFYATADPESPAFVKVGDHVGPETTVCIVEAMKVFNQIPAEISGKILAVLAQNGEPVEFGQPLFKVDTRG